MSDITAEPGAPAGGGSARAAALVFAVAVGAAFPLILALGSFHWFLRDEWLFLAGRDLRSVNDLFRPHARTHWSTLPIISYRVLWRVVGIRSYLPYQALVVAVHLTIVVLLRAVMRRAGVGPWMATVAAAPFVLFGPGTQNILWAFQIGFTGSIALGLVQLLLASHDGDVDRRDFLGIGAGVLALMCSGVGVTMAVAVGAAVLVLRGWRTAALHTVPLAVVYGVWALIEHPITTTPGYGYPSLGDVGEWLRSTVTGTFTSLGRFDPIAVALAVLLLVGLYFAWRPGEGGWRRARVALPAGLLVGLLAFSLSTVLGRWPYGTDFSRASRYLYVAAAMALPAIAVAADEVARRWRVLTPVVMALLLIPIPFNLDGFRDDAFFGRRYFDNEERLITTAVRMPFARDVPRGVRIIPDPYLKNVTIGFLLAAERDGRLRASKGPVTPREANELRVRLGVAEWSKGPAARCRQVTGPLDLRPARGATFEFRTPVDIATVGPNGHETSERVAFLPQDGTHLTIELPGLHLRVAPRRGQRTFTWCDTARP
jgi:hypothetical protein